MQHSRLRRLLPRRSTATGRATGERPPLSCEKEGGARGRQHARHLLTSRSLAPTLGNLWLTAVLSLSIAQVVVAATASRFALETYRVSINIVKISLLVISETLARLAFE